MSRCATPSPTPSATRTRTPSSASATRWPELIVLDARLSRILHDKLRPADAAERIALARLCQEYKKRDSVAARFYVEAFAAEPKLADDLRAAHRHSAACAAALAGCSQGVDADTIDEKQRARWRQQANDWLRAELATWGQLLAREPEKACAAAQKTLRHWQ
jgi:serine/threonine-protein kinase